MKRSEMIKIIVLTLHSNYTPTSGYEHVAQYILDQLEDNGMKPPECEVVIKADGIIQKLNYINYENSWEPEDEK